MGGFLGAWVLPVIPVIPLVTAVFGPVIRPVIRFARLGSLEVGWAGWLKRVSWTGVWTEAGVPSLELLELDDSQCVGWARQLQLKRRRRLRLVWTVVVSGSSSWCWRRLRRSRLGWWTCWAGPRPGC